MASIHVTVVDLDGEEHEVTRRNANDLVNHLGWKYKRVGGITVDELAQAPRTKKTRDEKRADAEAAAKAAAEVEDETEEEVAAAARKPSKKAKKQATPVKPLVEDDEPVIPYDQMAQDDIDAELASIDAEIAEEGKQ
ncbi:MAG: hypothetical protein AB7U75_14310 [Hyphomicrobiaceae bacterium]